MRVTHTKETRLVRVVCPHCGKQHVHGWPYGEEAVGHRHAHCTDIINRKTGQATPRPSNNGYHIQVDDTTVTKE